MAEKENKLTKAFVENKLSNYGVTKRSFYSIISLVVCFAFIIVLSVTQASFKKELLEKSSFWVDFAILSGLSIYGMITGQQVGGDVSKNNENGSFRASLKTYGKIFKTIDDALLFAYFDDWIENYRERKIIAKTKSILRDNGIHQFEVLDLDLKELSSLQKPYKKDWSNTRFEGKYKDNITYFVSYSDEQIEVIKYCLSGKVKVSKLPSSFFLDALSYSEKDMWESASNSGKKKTSYLAVNYTFKILMLLATCVLSAGLRPDRTEGTTQGDIWLSLTKRIFVTFLAFVWGIYIGYELTKIEKTYIEFKISILNQYNNECELKIYQPKSIEEQAKENYEKEVANEETTNNILE